MKRAPLTPRGVIEAARVCSVRPCVAPDCPHAGRLIFASYLRRGRCPTCHSRERAKSPAYREACAASTRRWQERNREHDNARSREYQRKRTRKA